VSPSAPEEPIEARATGAFIAGVGISPLALVAYEAVHKGRSPRLGALLTLAVGLLAVRHLTGLAGAASPSVHPTVWLVADTLLTAWWIVGAYKRGEGHVIAHPLGLLAAAAIGGGLWAARGYLL